MRSTLPTSPTGSTATTPSSTSRQQALERAVVDAVDAAAPSAIALLKRLVRTPSPSGAEGTAADLDSVVGMVHAAAHEHGTTIDVQSVGPHSENVIETLGDARSHAFVIEAHTDAVPEGDRDRWLDKDPFCAVDGWVKYVGHDLVELELGSERYVVPIRPRMSRIWQEHRGDEGRRIIYGRGSFDNKGCVASALLAMHALAGACRKLDVRLRGTVIAAYTVDEEESVTGIKRFATDPDSWLAAHGHLSGPRDNNGMLTQISGVALDGSYGWVPVIGHRGAVQFAITTVGRAAHAATPELGVNAVGAMARIIVALSDGAADIASTLAESLDTALLGPATLAVGTTIVGGGVSAVHADPERVVDRAGLNSIPDWCETTVDIRFPQGRNHPADTTEAKNRVIDVVRDHIEHHVRADGWTYTIRELVWGPPVAIARSFVDAEGIPLIVQARMRAAQVLGYVPHLETAPGGTDATFMINDAKIPTIVEMGPAGGRSHDVHEFVEVDSVIEGAKILALLAIDRTGVVD